jgi:hypothetical protein
MTPHEAADVGAMREKPMTGEITAFRWYVVQGYPPRLQWMERTMPPQWHDVPMVFVNGWPVPTIAEMQARASLTPRGEGD